MKEKKFEKSHIHMQSEAHCIKYQNILKTLPHLALQLLVLTEQRPGLKESMKGGGVDNETKNEYENYV